MIEAALPAAPVQRKYVLARRAFLDAAVREEAAGLAAWRHPSVETQARLAVAERATERAYAAWLAAGRLP